MEKKEIIGLSVVGLMGIISTVFGFAAEGTRIKESHVKVTDNECIYPSNNPASGLAITASAALMLARIIIIVLTGCSCCKRNPNRSIANCTFATACLVLSWFTFVIAQLTFVGGALIDGRRGRQPILYYCNVVKHGQFAIAASLSLASVILGIAYAYAFLSFKKNNVSPNVIAPSNQMGVAMGHPIHPPQVVQDPVFVHEDTYLRRQFT